jgi:quinol monooxygenase YgiN
MFMTYLKRLAALLPISALFIAPALSQAQLFSPLAALTSEASEPTHVAQSQETTVIKNALFVRLEAKPGKEKELAQFLHNGLDLARQEGTTPVWFALQLGPSTFGIFDAFSDEAGRQAHLNGPIAQALGANAPNLLAQAPSIERIDVLGTKLPQ